MKVQKFLKFIFPIIIGLLVAAVLKSYVLVNAVVPTGSMEPTIMSGDRLIGSKLSYKFNEPARGDIVTFYDPEGTSSVFVKRIVGLPGEKVKIISGKVYIDDSKIPLSEPYVNSTDEPFGDFGPYTVPEDCYFVMGDNRNQSYDSRYWKTTNFVSKETITSKIILMYYPDFKKME